MQVYREKKDELAGQGGLTPDEVDERLTTFMRQTVKDSFTNKMLSIADELNRFYLPANLSVRAGPQLTG